MCVQYVFAVHKCELYFFMANNYLLRNKQENKQSLGLLGQYLCSNNFLKIQTYNDRFEIVCTSENVDFSDPGTLVWQ